MDSRLTPSSLRSFGQEIVRSPGTSTNTKSSSARRTTRVLTTSAGVTPRTVAASARLRTGPCRTTRSGRPDASAAARAGLGTAGSGVTGSGTAGSGTAAIIPGVPDRGGGTGPRPRAGRPAARRPARAGLVRTQFGVLSRDDAWEFAGTVVFTLAGLWPCTRPTEAVATVLAEAGMPPAAESVGTSLRHIVGRQLVGALVLAGSRNRSAVRLNRCPATRRKRSSRTAP